LGFEDSGKDSLRIKWHLGRSAAGTGAQKFNRCFPFGPYWLQQSVDINVTE